MRAYVRGAFAASVGFLSLACNGAQGPEGPAGPQGVRGPKGPPGSGSTIESIHDGSRLRGHYRIWEDGAREFMGTWFDTMLNQSCSASLASDGEERCLPLPVAPTSRALYSDAACTKAILLVFDPATPPAVVPPGYVTVHVSGAKDRYLLVGAKDPSVKTYYADDTGPCMPVGTVTSGYYVYDATIVEPDTFVKSTIQ